MRYRRLPDHISLEEGALVEPLSVGIHASRRGNVGAGDRVIIFGAGPVGLLCAAAAKAAGAGHVTITDLVPARLEFAKTYYTDSQVLLQRPQPGEPNMEYAQRMTKAILETEELADCVIDCSGAETCVQMSVFVSKKKKKDQDKCKSLANTCAIFFLAMQERWFRGVGRYGLLCSVNPHFRGLCA